MIKPARSGRFGSAPHLRTTPGWKRLCRGVALGSIVALVALTTPATNASAAASNAVHTTASEQQQIAQFQRSIDNAINAPTNRPQASAAPAKDVIVQRVASMDAGPGGTCTTLGSAPTQTESCAFPAGSGDGTFTVPAGVSTITAELLGAQGSPDSWGGKLVTRIAVSRGQQFALTLGTESTGSAGGYPDGGSGGTNGGGDDGGGGGGGTRISLGGNILAEAGGGGGNGGSSDHSGGAGGSGGNLAALVAGSGADGDSQNCAASSDDGGGGGGGASAAGAGGGGGSGGTCVGVGSNATGGNDGSGSHGGGGGQGSHAEIDGGGSGGGGGGGWFGGGGGGGGGQYGAGGGGGGGGSNGANVSVATIMASLASVQIGGGAATISYPLQATTTTLRLSPNDQTAGGPVNVTAHVVDASNRAVTAGSVNFSGLPGLCASASLDADGNAKCVATPQAVGAFSVTAGYPTTGGYAASAATAGLSVDLDPTTTSASYTTSGTDATVTATVGIAHQSYGVVNGTVTVTVPVGLGSGARTCTFTVGPSGAGGSAGGSCTVHNLTPGTSYALMVTYADSTPTPTTAKSEFTGTIEQPLLAATPTLTVAQASAAQGNPLVLTGLTVSATATSTTGTVTVFDSPATFTAVTGAAEVPVGASILCSGIALVGSADIFSPSSADLATCDGIPPIGVSYLGVVFSGDKQTAASRSAPVTYTATPAPTSVSMTATVGGSPLGQSVASGTPITLTATVLYTSSGLSGQAVPGAQVTFFDKDDGVVVCATSTTLSCVVTPRYGDGSTHTYYATFAGSTTKGLAQPSGPSNSVAVTVTAPAASLTFSPVTSPVPAGQALTLTVTFKSADPNAGSAGRVAFFDASDETAALAGCGAVALADVGGALQATCSVTPPPGTSASYVAEYTGDPNTGEVDTQSALTVTTGPAGSTTTTSPIAASVFGSAVTLSATVSSTVTTPRAQPVGTVVFTAAGSQVCSATTNGSGDGTATADCQTSALPGGAPSVVATFVPTDAATAGSVATAATASVSKKSTLTSVVATVRSTTTATIGVTVTGGLATPPTGTVSVTVSTGGTPVAVTGCQKLTLVSGAAACQPAVPTVADTYTYTAAYSGDGNFAAGSGTGTLQVQDSGVACSGGFKVLHDTIVGAGGALKLSNSYLDLNGTANATSGDCTAATVIDFSVTATLFASVTGTVTGTITQGGGLCLGDGTLQGTSLASYLKGTFGITAGICFALDDAGVPSVVLSGELAGAAGQAVPLVNISDLGAVGVTLDFAQSAGSAVLDITTELDTNSGPRATLVGTISGNGDLTATLTTSGLTLFGAAVDLHGSIGKNAGGVSYSASASLPGPFGLAGAPGVTVSGVAVTLSADGLDVTGQADIGAAGKVLTASLQADITSVKKWTIALSTGGQKWTPIGGLSISKAITGTVSYDAAASPAWSYDFVGGDGTTAFATWNTASGASVDVDRVELSSTATCAGAGSGDPVVSIEGGVTADKFSATATGCIDLATSVFDLTGTTTGVGLVSGLTLNDVDVDLTGSNASATLTGSATAAVDVGGTALSIPMRLQVSTLTGGSLVIGGAADLTTLGLPVVGYVAYASAAVGSYDTGLTAAQLPGGAVVSLVKGFNARGVYTLNSTAAADLAALGVSAGSTLTFAATLSSTQDATFDLALSIPTLKLYTLTVTDLTAEASFVRAGGQDTLSIAITATVPSESGSAALALNLNYDASHVLTGTGSLTGLSILGQQIDLSGQFSDAGGTLTASLTLAPLSFSIVSGVSVTGFTATLSTDGLSVAGTINVPGTSTGLVLSGDFENLQNFSVTVSGTLTGWNPTPGITIAAGTTISGTITSATTPAAQGQAAKTTLTVDLKAAGGTLFAISPTPAVNLTVSSVELSNGPPAGGCTVTDPGDLWLGVTGSFSVTLGNTVTVVSTGCVDITSGALSLTATLPTSYSALSGKLTIGDATLRLSRNGSVFSASATATLTVAFGQQFDVTARLEFTSNGAFVIGAGIDLSKYLGTGAVAGAYLFFATQAVTAVPTDELGNFGPQDLAAGLTILGKVAIPQSFADTLNKHGISVPTGSSLTAKGTLDLVNKSVTLDIIFSLGANGQKLFSVGGTSLALDSGALELSISPTLVAFGLRVDATLTITPPASDSCNGTTNTIGLTGLIGVSDDAITASLTVSHWNDALGICGLDIGELTAQIGIDAEGLPSLGFVVQVNALPTRLAEAIGYQEGANLKLALNISADEFLVDIEIGTAGQSTDVLKPLTLVGEPNLIVVNYAKLYISPTGAKIGTTIYPAGFVLDFDATVDGVALKMDVEVNPAALSLHADAMLGRITAGSLTFGPTELKLDAAASPPTFDFELDGSIALGPGSVTIGPALKFTGYLNATVDISIGTSGLSASISATASVQGSNYLPQSACYYGGFLPYPCNYQWVDDDPLSIPQFTASIDLSSSGIDIGIPGMSQKIHLPFSSNADTGIATSAAYQLDRAPAGNNQAGVDAARFAPAVLRLPRGPTTTQALPAAVVTDAVSVRSIALRPQVISAAQPITIVQEPDVVDVDPPATSWQTATSMTSPRAFATAATLPDGRVLVAGGVSGSGATASAEIFDPDTDRWTSTGSMNVARAGAIMLTLPGGDVLVAGGTSAHGMLASSETYSPATGTWTIRGSLGTARGFATASLLLGGDVLVDGGVGQGNVPLASAEIYHPATATWTSTGSLHTAREFAAQTTLPSGQVLVAGGMGASGPLRSSELYDPDTGTWATSGDLADARWGAAAVLLRTGQVLVAGDSAFAERYSPATGQFVRTGIEHETRLFAATTELATGAVLTYGGDSATDITPNAAPTSPAGAEVFDPTTGLWTPTGAPPGGRAGSTASLLANGDVLIAGGADGIVPAADAYLYLPPAGSASAPGHANAAPGHSGSVPGHSGSAPGLSNPSGSLPNTGLPAGWQWVGFGGVALVLLGAGLILVRRRREEL